MIRRILSSFHSKITSQLCTPPCARLMHGLASSQPSSLNLSRFMMAQPKSILPTKVLVPNLNKTLLSSPDIFHQPTRTYIKYSLKKGTRKSVRVVIKKFFRLRWGIWIRTIAGRHNLLWKKSNSRKNRLQQHVFCNETQSKMLDKMVGPYWTRPRFYIEDPYEVYHSRENYEFTKTKPWRPPEC